jgi:hypothetical protein
MKQRTTLTYTPVIICSEVKLQLMRLSHPFLEDVLAGVTFSNSILRDSFPSHPFSSYVLEVFPEGH